MTRNTLARGVNSVVRYCPDKASEFIFRPMRKLDGFRKKCEDIAHEPNNGENVHKLAPMIEMISQVLSDPYIADSPVDCGDHHIQDAIDCLQVAARHLIGNAPTVIQY